MCVGIQSVYVYLSVYVCMSVCTCVHGFVYCVFVWVGLEVHVQCVHVGGGQRFILGIVSQVLFFETVSLV